MSAQNRIVHRRVSLCRVALTAVATYCVVTGPTQGAVGVRDFCCQVTMSDGLRLATDVYLPRFPKGSYPVILIRTPYPRNQFTRMKARFACREGFGLVVQEVRGTSRLHPEGPLFQQDGWTGFEDGHTTVRWIARQTWCSGKVVTWGPSAMGITQILLAPNAPAALKAQSIAMAPADMFSDAVYQGGVLREAAVDGWLAEMPFPQENLEAILAHPTYDAFWVRRNSLPLADRVNAPAIFIGGWHDAFLQGTIDSFVAIQNQGGPGARGKCRLVIGPWKHKDLPWIVDPRNAEYLPAAASPVPFFRRQLCGSADSAGLSKPVCYYVMGGRCESSAAGGFWRHATSWPPPSTPTHLFFHADGRLTGEAPGGDESRSFQYDPANPVPTIGGRNLMLGAGPCDQRRVESRSDVLVFSTAVLDEAVEVTGRIEAILYVSSDCPDTDFTVKLTDVHPDGRSILVCDGILRTRFRESFERPSLMEPGNVYPLRVDLWSTSTVFNRGHRIRVAVSSSNAPRFQPNPNTGEPILPPNPPRVATNTVHLGTEHPSSILLPFCFGAE